MPWLAVFLGLIWSAGAAAPEGEATAEKRPRLRKEREDYLGWLNLKAGAANVPNFPPGATIAVAFDKGIAKGEGLIVISDLGDGSSTRMINPKNDPAVVANGNLLLINLQDHPLEPETNYEVRLHDGAVLSAADPALAFAEPNGDGKPKKDFDFSKASSDASRLFLTTSAEWIMKIIPLRHVWVGTRALGTEFGTPGPANQLEKATLTGVETILAKLLDVKIELKGSDSNMKSFLGSGDGPPTWGPTGPQSPVPPGTERALPEPGPAGPDPLGFGLTPLPDVFDDEPPVRLRRRRPVNDSDGTEIVIPAGYMKKAIIADVDRNAFIIVDTRDRVEEIEAIIAKLDQPQLLVEVSVAILDVSDEATFDWESEFLAKSGAGMGALRTTDSVTQMATTLGSAGRPAGDPVYLSGGGFTANTVLAATRGDAFQITSHLRTLETDGLAQVLSRPSLLTINNQDATLTETVTFYVPVAGQIHAALIPVKSGTTIRILPHVVELKKKERRGIDLLVDITEGAPDKGNVDGVQAVGERRIQTQAVVRENESLLIAGSYQHAESRNQGALPVIGKIPVLGMAFKDKSVTRSKKQRMFLITPKVLEADTQRLSRQTERAADLLQPEAAGPAGLKLNRTNETQVQDAMPADQATGGAKPGVFAKLRRALHTHQNP